MKYNLKEFNKESLNATDQAWNKDLENSSDIFPGDVWRIINLARNNSNYQDKHAASLTYGIFDGAEAADSVVEVIISKSAKKWIKMIDCFIRPGISEQAYKKDTLAIEKLVNIYAAAIAGSMMLADHHQATVVKVFGRSEALLYILTSVAKNINESEQDLSVEATIEGRWLVVKRIKKVE